MQANGQTNSSAAKSKVIESNGSGQVTDVIARNIRFDKGCSTQAGRRLPAERDPGKTAGR